MKIGCCGWSHLAPSKFGIKKWRKKYEHKLQAYASIFDLVEVNSTFYRLPKKETAEKWRKLARSVNKDFEFTVKASQIITHRDKFSSRGSVTMFNKTKEIANFMGAKIILFQTPGSFKPTEENLEKIRNFFRQIDKENFKIVWEVRWKDNWKKDVVKDLFSDIGVNQCVDPMRQDTYYSKDLVYYRLHGFGQPMYNYNFSEEELENLKKKIQKHNKRVYILFNNFNMYRDAKTLGEFL